MKKIKLCGIGNFDKFNYYIFEKKQKEIEEVIILIGKIFGIDFDLYKEYYDKKENWKRRKIIFENFQDKHEGSLKDDNRVDIFYGKRKIFVTIICPLKLREKFHKELEKISYMPRPKKFKPIEEIEKCRG